MAIIIPGGGGSGGSGDTLPIADTTAVVKGSADPTKLVRIEADGLTGSTTRVITMPDADVDLGALAPTASPTFTGTVTIPTPFTIGAVSMTATGTELNYVAGVTSAIQTQLDAKAPLASPTFSGTATFDASGFTITANKIAASVAGATGGKVVDITNTKNASSHGVYGYLSNASNTGGAGIYGRAVTGYGGYFETTGASANPVVYIIGDSTHSGPLLSIDTEATNSNSLNLIDAAFNGTTVFAVDEAGNVSLADGAVIGFSTDMTAGSETGFSRPTTDSIAFQINGTDAFTFNSTGLIGATGKQLHVTAGVLYGSGNTSVYGFTRRFEAKTSDFTVLSARNNAYYTNTGAGGAVKFTITAAAGDNWTFVDNNATYRITLQPASGDVIIWTDGTSVTSTGTIVSTARYDSVDIDCLDAGTCIARNVVGTWSVTAS